LFLFFLVGGVESQRGRDIDSSLKCLKSNLQPIPHDRLKPNLVKNFKKLNMRSNNGKAYIG